MKAARGAPCGGIALGWCVLLGSLLAFGCGEDAVGPRRDTQVSVVPPTGSTRTQFEFGIVGVNARREGTPVRIRWDWGGDGSWDTPAQAGGTVTHVFERPGSYRVVGEMDVVGATPWRGEASIYVYPYGWQPGFEGALDEEVFAMTEFAGLLYVGGWFSSADGRDASGLVAWDGSEWSQPDPSFSADWVNALLVHGGAIYIGGRSISTGSGRRSLGGVARWDGLITTAVGDTLLGDVECLAVLDGDLYAGGTLVIPETRDTASVAVLRDGAWESLGRAWGRSRGGRVNCMASFGNQLWIGGSFAAIGESQASNIAYWDGAKWHEAGGGLDSSVETLYILGSQLLAGGWFSLPTRGVAGWANGSWAPFDGEMGESDLAVMALGEYRGAPIVAGEFQEWDGLTARNVARRKAEGEWEPLLLGVSGAASYVNAVAEYRGELYIGGYFTRADTIASAHIARWRE